MKIVQLAQGRQEYPYYIAVTLEGRFKGQYPPEIVMIPSLRNKWDRGGFGTGRRPGREVTSSDPVDLVRQLRQQGVNLPYDEVDIYVVRSPGRSREKLAVSRFLEAIRSGRQP